MKKDKQLVYLITRAKTTKDGVFFMLIKLPRQKPRVSMKNLDSISIDHSILDQDFPCRDWLNVMVLIMSGLRDGERVLRLNSGSLMRSLRQSKIITGSHILLISKEMEDLQMLDAQELIQDGGNYLDLMELSLEILRMIKFLMFKGVLMEKTRTSLSTMLMENSINNGISCTLTNGKVSPRKVSLMRDSVFTLKEISMLSLNCQVEDILT